MPAQTEKEKVAIVMQTEKALKALYAFVQKQQEQQENGKELLSDQGKAIWLQFALKKLDKKKTNPIRIPLKHSLYDRESVRVCFIHKDPGTQYKDLVKAEGLPISECMSVSHLRKNFTVFADRRALCNGFDLFLADERILPALPSLLGNSFFDKKKHPVGIQIAKGDELLKKEVEAVLGSTLLHLSGGSCISVKVGHSEMSQSEVLENISVALEKVMAKIPYNWKNVQAISVKTSDSISLPIYNSLPNTDVNTLQVPEPVIEQEEEEEEEKPKKKTMRKRVKGSVVSAAVPPKKKRVRQ